MGGFHKKRREKSICDASVGGSGPSPVLSTLTRSLPCFSFQIKHKIT